MHQVAMHVLFEHFGVNQVLTAKFVDLLFAYEFVLIVNYFLFLFLELLGDVLDVRHPFRGRPQLRNEVTPDPSVLLGS